MRKLIFPFTLIICLQTVTAIAQVDDISYSNRIIFPNDIKVGADRTEFYLLSLENKKVAIMTNLTGTIGRTHLVDSLLSLDINITKVFSPEHGFRGESEAGAEVNSNIDLKTGISIISLYGSHKKPTAEDFSDVDIVVFDIQDVGARFYTFISTMYYAIQSWFIAASKMKEKMIKLNKKINWNPKHIQEGRFGMWLENLKDWNLSRFKFWGTPLPVWRCVCGKEKIIGSVEELKNESTKKFTEYDLHRPWIDEIKLKCVCGKEMTRIKDLIDCWYDSGSATFAQFHYPFENKEEFEKRFPYDFISEAIDQTRGWFYTLHAISSMLFGKIAYKNVICAGHILDEKGEKMSKSKGNILSPREMFDSVGVDAVRLQMCTNDPGNSKRFSIEMIKESVLPFLNVLYNCKTYYNQLEDKKIKEKIEDKWIQSKLNNLILDSTQDLEEFNIEKAVQKIMNFVVNDFSRTYIRFTRERNDTKEIIGNVLKEVGLLLAPYAPYVSEWIFQEFEKGESVHLSKWSVPNKKKINKKLEEEFNLIQEIIERGLKERDISQIGLKWPLSKVEVSSKVKISKKLQEIIKTQLNVRKYIEKIHNDDELKVEMDFKMNSELIAEGYAREVSRKVQALRKKMGLNKENLIELTLEINKDFRDILMNQEKLIRERTNSKIVKFEEKFSSSRGEIENFKIKEHSGKVQIVRLRGSN